MRAVLSTKEFRRPVALVFPLCLPISSRLMECPYPKMLQYTYPPRTSGLPDWMVMCVACPLWLEFIR